MKQLNTKKAKLRSGQGDINRTSQKYMSETKSWSIEWAGRTLTVEIGKYAGQAHAACTCRYGDTEVLATVVEGGAPREGVDYFPLMVDCEEKFYAAGKIKGSRFVKREGRPTDQAVLMARMIDRTIRPLFDEARRADVQVIVTVFSIDDENDPDIPSLIASSIALSISHIPWGGPIGAIRVGQIEGELVLNPSYAARLSSKLDCVVAHTQMGKLIMVEAEGIEVPDDAVLQAIELAKKHNQAIISFISGIQKEIGKPKIARAPIESLLHETELHAVRDFLERRVKEVLFSEPHATKRERLETIDQIKVELDQYLTEQQIGKEKREKAIKLVKKHVETYVSEAILTEKKRVDGRTLDDIRTLEMEVGLFPRTHGSAHFSRGETQVVSVVTLGSPGDVLFLDTMESEEKKHFMHHYNFPPYSVGEVAPLRGPGRREIGHGALAEKALSAVLPSRELFPYTIRIVSEVLSSNGSSSMASACGSSLALMDAGVPITHHVAGIAMGLASRGETYLVFTDLQDLEDGAGGMDFKICGTTNGITAIQMDTKTDGLPDTVVIETFRKARSALDAILLKMSVLIARPRGELSPHAPRIYTLHISPEKIGLVIGPQGKMINSIIEKTEVAIDIEKDGTVLITGTNREGAEKAIAMITDLTREVKVGDVYEGQVTRILDFGAMVELTPNQTGMVHVSNLANDFVKSVGDVVKIGDMLKVKVIEKDEQGRINLAVDGVEPKSGGRGGDRGGRGGDFGGRRTPQRRFERRY